MFRETPDLNDIKHDIEGSVEDDTECQSTYVVRDSPDGRKQV